MNPRNSAGFWGAAVLCRFGTRVLSQNGSSPPQFKTRARHRRFAVPPRGRPSGRALSVNVKAARASRLPAAPSRESTGPSETPGPLSDHPGPGAPTRMTTPSRSPLRNTTLLALRRNLFLLLTLCLATPGPLLAQEFRAAWADVFHAGMGSQTEVNNIVSALVTGHYNALVVQVVGYMDSGSSSHGAQYKSTILPWSTRVTASFDPLAYLCTQAHANGIEVHAWLGGSGGGPYRVSNSWPPAGNATLAAHPEWFMVARTNSEGGVVMPYHYTSGSSTYNYVLLDMGSPDAQEYLVSIVKELVTNYPIDGINWDDEIDTSQYSPMGMCFPAYNTTVYTNSGLARYRRNTGYVGTPSATDAAYNDYRRRFKNELMARVQAEIQSIKTNPRQPLRHTSAALAYSPVPGSCDFTTSTPYTYYCDWAGMLQHGWVDAVIPQTYSSSTFSTWADRIAACWQYNRQVFPGIGAYLNTDATTASQIAYTRSKGLKGNSIYSYAVPNSAGTSDWWAYAAANVYTNVVPTPPMPWRNPATATEGIIWGRVTDANTGLYVDDATVTVTDGPTVRTDGNGYYVATLVPAGAGGTAHSVTASKAEMSSATTNAIALAGDIVRYDLRLNAVTNVAPAITTQPASQVTYQGNDVTFTVAAAGTPPLAYQWRFYGTNLPGATTTSLGLTAVATNRSGPYTAVATNAYGSATSQVATLTVYGTFQAAGVTQLWSLAPYSRPYLTTNQLPNERGLAYNPMTKHLLLVSRTSPNVYVLDAATGADLNQLSMSAVSGGTYPLLMIGVADDGVVYAANLTSASASTSFTLYRWANDSSNMVPTVAFSGNPTPGNSQRYGDTLDVRGAGAATQIIIGSRSSTNVVIFTTTDGANFTAKNVVVPDAPAGSFGLGITFGAGSTFWGKASNVALRQVAYDLAAGAGSSLHVYADPAFPNAVAPIGASPALNFLAGIRVSTASNLLSVYNLGPVSTNGAPAFIASVPFPGTNENTSTGSGSVDFGPSTIYALCPNNGILALQILRPITAPPRIDSITLLSGGQVQLQVSAEPGLYTIEASASLAAWSALFTLTNTGASFAYLDSETNQTQRYYRVRRIR
jgi:uncharacterized lipoprotein YddW (UPF0748 family)